MYQTSFWSPKATMSPMEAPCLSIVSAKSSIAPLADFACASKNVVILASFTPFLTNGSAFSISSDGSAETVQKMPTPASL